MRNGKMKLMGLIAVAALGGCATTPPPVTAVGEGAYRVIVTGAPIEKQEDINLRAIAVANNYCSAGGKQLMFRQSTESEDHNWSEDLTFVCVDANDPAYMRVGVQRDSAVVAQQ